MNPSRYQSRRIKSDFALMMLSIGLHLVLIAGLVLISVPSELPARLNTDDDMAVMMLDLSDNVTFADQSLSLPPAVEAPAVEPESVTTPEVEQQPEMVIDPQPVTEPLQEPKIIIPDKKVEPKSEIKPKADVKPVVVKPAVVKPVVVKPVVKKTESPSSKPVTSNSQVNQQTSPQQMKTATIATQSQGAQPLSRAKPVYPDRARAMNIEGQVKVRFDVDNAGKVQNIQIVSETPANIFARDVRRAMQRWTYAANRAAKNLETTFVFKLNGKIDMQ